MRFIEDGPTIPDELLVARDEGRVVFFCGAGISRARAGLSDFFGLAKQVMHALGVSRDHVTRKVLRAAKESEVQHGVAGLISVDRIFGMLEREFTERDIEAAVANALRPKLDVDLSAHRTLVQLATTPSHKIRLVTTNFDRLFNDCDPAANAWKPPRLPDPSRPDELDGIVYLHGRANADYSGAEGDGFVLSSSEFGRAYLSQGWATQFFRAVIEKYVVVFVGYAADDPPVQYLLEALNKPRGSVRSIYAFQSGSADEAAARWRRKGIEAIAYAGENQHALLWRTLEAWADPAADPKRWHQSVLEFAKIGPCNLRPYQRGQVAHLVSTVEGAHQLAELEDPISAEWLCVFDPHRRYATPEPHYRLTAGALPVDPFEKYGIDFDVVPSRIDPNEYLARRTVPERAWDCFATNRLDKGESTQHAMSSLRGSSATHPTEPPVRLIRIAVWFGKVAHEAAAVRWAARQSGLHPVMRRNVTWKLQNRKAPEYRVIKQAWRTLFEVWDAKVEFYDDWFNLKQIIEADGWDGGLARGYARVNRPRMKISFSTPFDPHYGAAVDSIGDLFPRDVAYPEHFETLDVPSEWLPLVTRELRRNIEVAVALETEIGGYGLNSLDPLASDLSTELFGVREAGGLSGAIKSYIWHFERLLAADLPAAKQELLAWPDDGDAVFSQLRIWACGNPALVSAEAYSDVITSLSSTAFWNSYLQRDLLTTLIGRWIELPESGRRLIEGKLLEGPVKWPNEEQADYDERRARGVLERVSWLGSMGCAFVLIEKAELDRLELLIPHWKSAYAERAADSMESRGGFVQTDTDYKALLEIPLAEVTSVALKRSGRQESFLVENTPFAGLAAAYPIRAFRALTLAAKRGEYPAELWRQFFNAQTRENDCAKFMALIAERLCQLPMTAMEDLLRLLSAWLLKL